MTIYFLLFLFLFRMAFLMPVSVSRSAGRTGVLFGHPAQGHLAEQQIFLRL